jgi:RNA 3'-terminal phosphate cyclase (ATP)
VSSELVEIDGGRGEGGGQIVRSACTLSVLTGRPVRVVNVRARRPRPGLARQHMTAVLAAARICRGQAVGATVGSSRIELWPGELQPGRIEIDIGSAGATGLVFQTLLLPLALAAAPSEVLLIGGTHNTKAPPFEFLDRAYLPLLRRMAGSEVARITVERAGFYPRGGGRVRIHVEPIDGLRPLELVTRSAVTTRRATATVWNLPRHIADRELAELERRLAWPRSSLVASERSDSIGAGNAISIELGFDELTEVVTAIGERGVPAEQVAASAADEAARHLASTAPVGEHLADQLLLPLAVGEGGRFRTVTPTPHTLSQVEVIQAFLDVPITLTRLADDLFDIVVAGARLLSSRGARTPGAG